MSGIDFSRSDLSPGLLCELVLKDEFTFQIPALEIFPKSRGGGGHSYIIEDMDVRQGKFWTLRRQIVEHFRKYISYVFPRFTATVRFSAPARFSTPHKTSNFD